MSKLIIEVEKMKGGFVVDIDGDKAVFTDEDALAAHLIAEIKKAKRKPAASKPATRKALDIGYSEPLPPAVTHDMSADTVIARKITL